jgi:zinc transport system permease protein
MSEFILHYVDQIALVFGTDPFVVMGLFAVILVSLICGGVGALVVGNRMAFFSDALAHCSFAGLALGIIVTLLVGGRRRDMSLDWILPVVMIVFGVLIGIAIAYVRERTTLASDTVIGVFFAGAVGFGAVLFGTLKSVTNKNAEVFLFGSVNTVDPRDLVYLAVLGILTAIVIAFWYNQFIFASFNASLARSRRIPVRLYSYLFIGLLALVVNICIQAVGILLINALLIVPAATASNLSRNLRQMYWWTTVLSLAVGLGGNWIGLRPPLQIGSVKVQLGTSGCIVLLTVVLFAISMFIGPKVRRQPVA